MDLGAITVNKQSSIRIAGSRILYFDAFEYPEEMHDADYIFLTHEHFDHFDPVSIRKVMKEDSVIVAPQSMEKKVLSELEIAKERCVFCKPGMAYELSQLKVEAVPAYNVLKPFHLKKNGWLGYIVHMDGTAYYVAGDTDVNADVKKVICDVAMIPIGGHYTMDKVHAAKWICSMKPKAVIPTHYGAVVGSPADGEAFKRSVEEADKEIQVELKL